MFYDDRTGEFHVGRLIAALVGLAVVIVIVSFACSWINTGAEIVGPTNVKAQHRAIIGDYEGMVSAAENACDAESAAKRSQDDPTFVEDPGQAYAGSFRRLREDYQRRQKNLFEAKIVGPSGYPTNVPLRGGQSWCKYANTLTNLNPR
jgi:uncharacterized membrane protein YbhN (UPF0104 family)